MIGYTLAEDLGNILVFVSTILAVACVIAYQVKTRGAWNRSDVGRHLMSFMVSMAAVLILSAIRTIIVYGFKNDEPDWFYDLRIFVFASLPVVLARQLYIILTADRRDRDSRS